MRVAVDAIIGDTRRLLVCTVLCQGEYGIDGRFAGVPARVGREGIHEVVEMPLGDRERALLSGEAPAGNAAVRPERRQPWSSSSALSRLRVARASRSGRPPTSALLASAPSGPPGALNSLR